MVERQRASRGRGRPRGNESHCREQLLDAGLTVFSDLGYDGAGLRAIAQRAGCDVSMIAHHFGSKSALWRAVVEREAQRLQADLRRASAYLAPGSDSIEVRIGKAVDQLFEVMVEHPEMVRFAMREMVGTGERVDTLIELFVRPVLAAYAPLWQAAIEAGYFGVDDPYLVHNSLFGAIAFLVMSAPMMARMNNCPVDLGEMKRTVTEGLLMRKAPA